MIIENIFCIEQNTELKSKINNILARPVRTYLNLTHSFLGICMSINIDGLRSFNTFIGYVSKCNYCKAAPETGRRWILLAI